MSGPEQQRLGLDPEPTVEEVIAAIRRIRIDPVARETQIYDYINRELVAAGITFTREARLGPRSRIDYLLPGGLGIEVKKGKPSKGALLAQAVKYCGFDQVRTLLLVVERCTWLPTMTFSSGKRVYYIGLNRLWGVAL